MDFIGHALGCQTVVHDKKLSAGKLGSAKQVSDVLTEKNGAKVIKIMSAHDFLLSEMMQSLHNAQCVDRLLVKCHVLVAKGDTTQIEVTLHLKEHAVDLTG